MEKGIHRISKSHFKTPRDLWTSITWSDFHVHWGKRLVSETEITVYICLLIALVFLVSRTQSYITSYKIFAYQKEICRKFAYIDIPVQFAPIYKEK